MKKMISNALDRLYPINPELTLKIVYRLRLGKKLNLKRPKLYNEKLQWIKLNVKDSNMPICCDKFWVRGYVESKGLGKLLIEQYWDGFNPDKIPYAALPKEIVIKTTHGSTFNIIAPNKDELKPSEVSKKLKKWLQEKYIPRYGEWFYGVKQPRIIVEELLKSEDGEQLKDYKVFCFNGVPRFIRIDMDRFGQQERAIFDTEWKKIENVVISHRATSKEVEKPECLDELLEYARILSKEFLHARVDFYIINNKIYFGEITFTPGAGYLKIEPESFELQMGEWLKLPID